MKCTVLVVEDEQDLLDTMHDAIKMHGYDVIAATDGRDALEKVAGVNTLCLVVLDLVMPRLDGWQFVEQFRREPAHADVPIVVHSSSPQDPPPGVARVVQKPLPLSRLLAVVNEYCAPAQAAR